MRYHECNRINQVLSTLKSEIIHICGSSMRALAYKE